jgi:hypothetical protein
MEFDDRRAGAPPLTFLPTQLKFTLLTKYGKQVASIENARQRVSQSFTGKSPNLKPAVQRAPRSQIAVADKDV